MDALCVYRGIEKGSFGVTLAVKLLTYVKYAAHFTTAGA